MGSSTAPVDRRAAMRAVMRRRLAAGKASPVDELAAAPPPDPAPRLAACRACDHYRPASDRCGLCGCADTMTRRAASRFGTCPAGRWPA